MSDGLKLSPQPVPPAPKPAMIARKCIVCGTTKHEHIMKPFLLKGEQLSMWTNNFFNGRRNKIFAFYAKLRYTLNPFSCVEHFTTMLAPSKYDALPKAGKRACSELLSDSEEPPTIKDITERKESPPPPDEHRAPRTEREVNDAVMAILKNAKEEMDKEDETKKILKKITRRAMGDIDEDDDDLEEFDSPVKEKKKKRNRVEKRSKADGNEADSDNSEIDVEAVDSENCESAESSGESESEKDISEVISVGKPPSMAPCSPLLTPPRFSTVPRARAKRPYLIAPKPVAKQTRGVPALVEKRPAVIMNVPKRLTLNTATGKHSRPSWVSANPGQMSLASVLQRFWNEDGPSSLNRKYNSARSSAFGRSVIPGTKTRFIPASLAQKLKLNSPSTTKSKLQPSSRRSTLSHNPPLSPSRLLIASEETIDTVNVCASEGTKTPALSSSYSSNNEESDVEVCDMSERQPSIVPEMIEFEMSEGTRSRTISTVLSSSCEEEEEENSSHDEEIDVETIDESEKRQKLKEDGMVMSSSADHNNPATVPTVMRTDRRKQRVSVFEGSRAHVNRTPDRTRMAFYRAVHHNSKFISPPSAMVNPPMKLLSSTHFSMKDLLQAQGRAASTQPIRINTSGAMNGFSAQHLRNYSIILPKMHRSRQSPSEWARLEKVMEKKMAEHRAQMAAEKKRKALTMIDPLLIAVNPPPVLERVDKKETEQTRKEKKDHSQDRFTHRFLKAFAMDIQARRSKVLRMRFHRKKEEVDLSKMKVLDRSTCPKGVARVEEVEACPSLVNLPIMDRMESNDKNKNTKKVKELTLKDMMKKDEKQVTNPSLVIVKTELMELREKMKAPPPTPVVGIPNREESVARREMYERKRLETAWKAQFRYGGLRVEKEEWRRMVMAMNGKGVNRGMGNEGEEEEDEEENSLVAETMEIIKKVKAEKMKEMEVEETKKGQKMEEFDKDDMCMLSDIENDEKVEEREIENDMIVDEDEDEEWTMKGVVEKNKTDYEDSDTRRKSHRLKVKRAAMSKDERTLIWKSSDDDGEEVVITTPATRSPTRTPTPTPTITSASTDMQSTTDTGKKKRGRPRLSVAGPPPKKKREENKKMTAEEKEVLSRVFNPVDKHDEEQIMTKPKLTPMKPVKKETSPSLNEANEQNDDDKMEELEKQEPKEPGDYGVIRGRKMSSWKQKLGETATVKNAMGGRLCSYCMRHTKRYIWIPNEAMALMDHARTHCVETLMCPNKDCTYMNTQRARISQHMSYVHKRWGMPIDLSEVYPSMQKSLMLRLRQCFPDLPSVSVCYLCRMAVPPISNHLRWHAQTHLDKQIFECTRDICTLKFSTEDECLEHIKETKCRGSVKNGLTDEMEEEVTKLVFDCFGNNLFPQPIKKARKVVPEKGSVGNDKSTIASTSKESTQEKKTSEEKGTTETSTTTH